MKSLPMTTELEQWATIQAKQFLQIHDPDVILATTLDFGNLESTINDNTRATFEEPWTKIGKNSKKTLTHIHPLQTLSLIPISESTRLRRVSYAVYCLKKTTESDMMTINETKRSANDNNIPLQVHHT